MKRFIYVRGPESTRLHIKYGSTRSEGVAACGRAVVKGWKWHRVRARGERVCKQCERAR